MCARWFYGKLKFKSNWCSPFSKASLWKSLTPPKCNDPKRSSRQGWADTQSLNLTQVSFFFPPLHILFLVEHCYDLWFFCLWMWKYSCVFQVHSQTINMVMFHLLCALDTTVHLSACQEGLEVLPVQRQRGNVTLTGCNNLMENMFFVIISSWNLKWSCCGIMVSDFRSQGRFKNEDSLIKDRLINVGLIFTTNRDLFSFTW